MIAVIGYIIQGHHLNYFGLLLSSNKVEHAIVTRKFHDAYIEQYSLNEQRVKVHIIDDCEVGEPNRLLTLVNQVVKENKSIERVLLTSIDELWKPLACRSLLNRNWLVGDCSLEGVWIVSNFFYEKHGLKPKLSMLLLKLICKGAQHSGHKIFFLNEDIYENLKEKFTSVKWCPDPFWGEVSPPSAQSADVPVLLMAGHHKPRKGTQWAVDALKSWEGVNVRLAIVGEISDLPDLASSLQTLPASVKVELVDRRISEVELDQYYSDADVVLLPYRKFGGSSGVFVNAIARGKPVVVPDWGVIGSRTKHYELGKVFSHDSENDFRNAIEDVLIEQKNSQNHVGATQFLARNSPEMFIESFIG